MGVANGACWSLSIVPIQRHCAMLGPQTVENKNATLEKKISHCELIYTKKQAINLILERIMKKGELRCTLKLIV